MPTPPLDPFDLLGLPPTFDLTRPQIERAYLARAADAHPDTHAQATRDDAQHASARLNDAVRTLKDPEARAAALLHRLDGPSSRDDKSLPPGFLESIMATRLEIEESLSDPASRSRWEAWAAQQRADYSDQCSALFRALASPPAQPALRQIRATLNAWRYIERLIEQLDPAYDPARADFKH